MVGGSELFRIITLFFITNCNLCAYTGVTTAHFFSPTHSPIPEIEMSCLQELFSIAFTNEKARTSVKRVRAIPVPTLNARRRHDRRHLFREWPATVVFLGWYAAPSISQPLRSFRQLRGSPISLSTVSLKTSMPPSKKVKKNKRKTLLLRIRQK